MFDFKLTPKGDIILSNNETISSFNLSFSLSKYGGQRISFFISGQDKKQPRHQQSISFYWQNAPERTMAERDVNDVQEKLQAARIELKTEHKNVYNYDIGSTFYSLNHTIYKNESSLSKIQDAIETVMKKYFPRCTVKVAFKETEGYFWCQTLFATVYDTDNKVIGSFEL